MATKREIERYIREAARARGINPEKAVAVWRAEGAGGNPAEGWQSYATKNGRREPSFGPFQLLVGGPGTGFPRGLGNKFMKQTGVHPKNPDAVFATIDFALDEAAQTGWGAWYGAKAAGIGNWEGLRGAQPRGVNINASSIPDTAPLPPMRFKDIAARQVAPTDQSVRAGMSLAQLPTMGGKKTVQPSLRAPESAPIPTAALRMPDPARFAPDMQVASAPSRERFGYSEQPAPSRYGLASIMNELGVGSARAAPMRPTRPDPALTDSQFNARFRSGAPLPMQEAYKHHSAPPSAPPSPPSAIDPKILAAYQQMAASRMAPPPTPAALSQPSPLGVPQTFSPNNAPQPTFMANPELLPPLGPPQVITPHPVYKPAVPKTPMADFPSAPPQAPASRPMDVYSGLASSAQDGMGNTVFSDPRGTGITNKFGATTYSQDGLTTASGGIGGSMGLGGMFEADPTLNGRSQFGNAARGLGGGMGGAAVGGLLGPLGSLLGAAIGSELAKPKGGRIGDLVRGVRNINGMEFARPQGGLAFPGAPGGGNGRPHSYSERTQREMRDISPRAERDISRGRGGLY